MQGVGLRELLSMTDMFPDQTGYTWQVRLIGMKLLTNVSPGSAGLLLHPFPFPPCCSGGFAGEWTV